jgi:hypothetical protein
MEGLKPHGPLGGQVSQWPEDLWKSLPPNGTTLGSKFLTHGP